MEKLFDKIKSLDFIRNCILFAPIIFLFYYPRRKKYAFWTIDKFLGKDVPEKERRRLARRIIWSKVAYHFDFPEYFLYEADRLSPKGKRLFISFEDNKKWADKMNRPENTLIFANKMETYKRFSKFYGREVCLVSDSEDGFKAFSEFAERHPKFIAKPLGDALGNGVAVFDTADYGSKEELYKALVKKYRGEFLAEELIIQVEELAKFHPSSANTLRMPTYRFDDRTEIRHPFLRIGQHGSVVDNAGAGGIFALIDEKSGIVFSAVDELGKSYVIHPDSGEQIIGYKIPQWEEAKVFAKKLAQVVPDNKYTGWDIALTEKGWVMVEGNVWAQFVHQIPLKKGFREELEEILTEMNKG